MNLDEAIQHCCDEAKEKRHDALMQKGIDVNKYTAFEKCADEHIQLAQWLEELKAYKIADGSYLERCPFCGHPAKLESDELPNYSNKHSWRVVCTHCYATVGSGHFNDIYTTTEEAISKAVDKWNQRAII